MTALATAIAALFAFAPVRAEKLAAHTTRAAQQYGVEVAWFAATLAHESSYETTARNCAATFNARQTRLLAAMIRERLASPSSEPMSLPRLRR